MGLFRVCIFPSVHQQCIFSLLYLHVGLSAVREQPRFHFGITGFVKKQIKDILPYFVIVLFFSSALMFGKFKTSTIDILSAITKSRNCIFTVIRTTTLSTFPLSTPEPIRLPKTQQIHRRTSVLLRFQTKPSHVFHGGTLRGLMCTTAS